ncbi:MAG: DUF3644 domain-containing protein [Planctomycetes bacterium]|nr:DUF3644 domain-containing protein [Planctomycetota bacterium]
MSTKIARLKLSYVFFKKHLSSDSSFTRSELAISTGWSEGTITTYINKRWHTFLKKLNGFYKVDAIEFRYSEEEYLRLMSQKYRVSADPYKPLLSEFTECLVNKARECAILAIDIYNRPMTSFRSHGFTVMMIIAWTSLMHAIFEKCGIDYFYYDDKGKPILKDDEPKAWELKTCINQYQSLSPPVTDNLRFFITLRNKIEHRYAPAIDLSIYGECQALLLNFEELLVSHFTPYYSLDTTLSIPLQVITSRHPWQHDAMKHLQAKHFEEIRNFIDTYRDGLSQTSTNSNDYSFKVFLVPKVGNHRSSSDLAFEFIKFDPNNPEQYDMIEKGFAVIKEKTIQVANQGKYKPTYVCAEVSKAIKKPFDPTFMHSNAWKFYKVRKTGFQADGCKTEFCQYDEAHNSYVYTQKWIDFLIMKLLDNDEYNKVRHFNKA